MSLRRETQLQSYFFKLVFFKLDCKILYKTCPRQAERSLSWTIYLGEKLFYGWVEEDKDSST